MSRVLKGVQLGRVLPTPGVLHPMVGFKIYHPTVLHLVDKNKINVINSTIGCNTSSVGKNIPYYYYYMCIIITITICVCFIKFRGYKVF